MHFLYSAIPHQHKLKGRCLPDLHSHAIIGASFLDLRCFKKLPLVTGFYGNWMCYLEIGCRVISSQPKSGLCSMFVSAWPCELAISWCNVVLHACPIVTGHRVACLWWVFYYQFVLVASDISHPTVSCLFLHVMLSEDWCARSICQWYVCRLC